MKHINIKSALLRLLVLAGAAASIMGCTDVEADPNDIVWPVPQVNVFEPAEAVVGSEVTLRGEALSKVNSVQLGGITCEVISLGENELKVKLPRRIEQNPFTLRNQYRQQSETAEMFKPIYLAVENVQYPDRIVAGSNISIKGDNVDLVDKVYLNSTELSVNFTSAKEDEIKVTVPSDQAFGETAILSMTTLQGNEVPVSDPIPMFYGSKPAAGDLVLMDFEDGVNQVIEPSWTNVTITSGINLDPAVKAAVGSNYQGMKLDAANRSGDWNWFGYVEMALPDLSDFNDPHLTFYLNTNGTDVYAQAEMLKGGSKFGGDLVSRSSTNGWEIVSFPIASINGDWGAEEGSDRLRIAFTTADLPNNMEIYLDQVMITDGKKVEISIDNFESGIDHFTAADWTGVPSTHGLNLSGLSAYEGSNYQSVILNEADRGGDWSWFGYLEYAHPDLSDFKDPYLTFYMHTNGTEVYIQCERLIDGAKYGGDLVSRDAVTEWTVVSVPLSSINGDWGTDEGDDRLRIAFTTADLAGMEIHIDDIKVTEGKVTM
ncbi:IPT/TIG domain-containing protein [Limibacter armeniacum]|uniref:IPT/TIG domain-containing protein n=1 Tax=Limibacter armeniacum TaxID=466084 RepID=UPI002FE53A87